MTATTTITYLPSWKGATEALRICDEDGTYHFTYIKALAESGAHYLTKVNEKSEPTRPMLISTAVHQLILGPRADKKVVVFDGDRRGTNAHKECVAANPGDEVMTAPEWAEAKEIARWLQEDPLIREHVDGAQCEVPLTWEEGGLKCSTSGVDFIKNGMLGDLKGTARARPELWKRTAFSMFYHVQLVWYRRGARANGIDVSRGMTVLGYEMAPPYSVVPLEMTEQLIDLGERTLALWLEKLRVYRDSCPAPRKPKDWPSYVQSPMPWELPAWMSADEEDD